MFVLLEVKGKYKNYLGLLPKSKMLYGRK